MSQKERQHTPSGFESEFPVLNFDQGEWIYRRGQRDDCMYVIESGRVELLLTDPHSTAEKRIGVLERGDFLGELGVLEEDRRSSCARALEDCRLLPLDGEALQQIAEQQPGLAFRMLRSVAERCGRLESELFDMWIDFFHEKADTNPPGLSDAAAQAVTLSAPSRRQADASTAVSSTETAQAGDRDTDDCQPSTEIEDATEMTTAEIRRSDDSAVVEPWEKTEPIVRPPDQFEAFASDGPSAEVLSGEGQTVIAPLPSLEELFPDDRTRKLRRPGSEPPDEARGAEPQGTIEDSQALIETQQPKMRVAGSEAQNAAWARLVSLDDGLQFLIREEFETTIGRSSHSDPFVPDIDLATLNDERTVSRRHASIFVHQGQYSLVEHDRVANGTSVNGIRLVPGRPQPLSNGDRLCFGTVILMFRQGAP